jgi:plastocyanin
MEAKKMKWNLDIKALLAGLLLLYLPVQAGAGSITGTVKVRGLRSPANILVYLNKTPAVAVNLSGAQFVMDQRNLTFLPHILPVPVGATVSFPNNDKVDHNVFSLSRTKKFSLGSYKPGETKTVQFDKPGFVELRCDVHAEMLAYIMIMKNPYFAVTDAKGRFEIPDLNLLEQVGIQGVTNIPSGKHFIKTWHEKLRTKKQAVMLPDDGKVAVQLDLMRGTPSVLYK